MAQTKADKNYTNVVGGLITEAGPLNFPEGASSDEDNMIPTATKSRRRRLGMDYEVDAVLTSFAIPTATASTNSISTFEWRNVAGDGLTNFLAVQVGSSLYFYDLASQPLSQGLQSFTIDLTAFQKGTDDVAQAVVSMAAGDGKLFVTSDRLKPFFITYDVDTVDAVATEITIAIRDFEGVEDGLEPDEEPTTLSDEHNYNLKNQGWVSAGTGVANPITTYQSSTGEYPPNSKQWWTAKNTSGNFDPAELNKQFFGNALAPKGHFILDALNKQRTDVSGVPNLDDEVISTGPSAVSFFASRAWYVLGNTLYFSQIIERDDQVGKCYQEQDPTAEILNEPVDSDGGTIIIPDMGKGKALFVSGNSIIVYADNGTWSISGSIGSGFTATDLVVDKVSDIGIESPQSLVDIEGTPMWWSRSGIYTVVRSQTTDRLIAQSLTENTIKSYFENTIPEVSREFAVGDYDEVTKRVGWLWKSVGESTDVHMYDKLLVLDMTTGGFYPQTIESLDTESPYVSSIFSTSAVNRIRANVNIVDSVGNTIVDAALNDVTVSRETINTGTSQTKFLAFEPDIGTDTVEFTFSAFNNQALLDWQAKDSVGVNYSSYVETGDITEGDLTGRKSINYLYLFLENTADNLSCLYQTKWDWSNSGNSGRWSRKREAYRNTKTTHDVTISKLKARGYGKGLRYRFESSEGKDLQIAGWASSYAVTTED